MVTDDQERALEAVVGVVVTRKACEGLLPRDELVDWCRDIIVNTGYPQTEPYFEPAERSGDPSAFERAEASVHKVIARVAERVLEEHRRLGNSEGVNRLDGAFAELEASGIITRQALGETLTDCAYRMHHEEIPKAESEGVKVRGFATFNKQALENAVGDGVLDLAYGAVSGLEAESKAIAREVLEVLLQHGVDASWSGNRNHGIQVKIKPWRRVYPD